MRHFLWTTGVVPAAAGDGSHPPRALKLSKVPAADLVAGQRVRCQVTDVEAGEETQEVVVGYPAGGRDGLSLQQLQTF